MPSTGNKRKRMYRRKRTFKRRFNIPRSVRPKNPTLHCRRFGAPSTMALIGNDINDIQYAAHVFKITDLQGYAEFTNLFDRFRITGIKYRWVLSVEPTGNAITTQSNRGLNVKVGWCKDYNDSNTPTSYLDLYERPNYQEIWLNSGKMASRWYYFKPATLTVGYETGVNSSYTADFKSMIDTDSYTTPHYGIKAFADNNVSGQVVLLECYYYLKFAGMK